MNKIELKEKMISIQNDLILNLEKTLNDYNTGADLDEDNTLDIEDLSHQDEFNDIRNSLSSRYKNAKTDLENLKDMNFDESNSIEKGAIVQLNKLNYVIGIAIPKFKLHDKTYVGISENAPIIKHMKSKNIGESFMFNDKKFVINDIL
jgi:hypothetical protein